MNHLKYILLLILFPACVVSTYGQTSFSTLESKADSLWFNKSFVELKSVLDNMLELSEENKNISQKVETLIHLHEYEAYHTLDNDKALDNIINAIDMADTEKLHELSLKARSRLIYFHQSTTQNEELVVEVLKEMKEINGPLNSEFYTFVNAQWEAQINGTMRLLGMVVSDTDVKKSVSTIKETLDYFDPKDPNEIFYYQQSRRCVLGFYPDFFSKEECLKYIEELKEFSGRMKEPLTESANLVFEGTYYALMGQNELLIEELEKNEDKLNSANHGLSKFYHQLLLSAYENTEQFEKALIAAEKMHFHDQEVNQLAFANRLEAIRLSNQSAEFQLKNELLQLRNYLFYGVSSLLFLGLLLTYVAFRKIKNQNEIIIRQKANLIEINQSKNKLFGILSHDLQGPIVSLNDVSEKVQFLVQKKEWAKLDKMTNQINRKTQNLQQILENILPWMSVQINDPKTNLSPVPLRHFLDSMDRELDHITSSKNIRMTNSIPYDYMVEADQDSMKIVIRNVINNAVKFTASGGAITLEAEKTKNGMVHFSISDTGVGIPQNRLDKIFSDYTSTTGTMGEKGNGLGLKLCKDLMVAMDGDLTLESVVGEGTRVILSLNTP